jgi:hypothetical protein
MEIFRTQRPEILKWVAPHIVEAPDYSKETILANIVSGMLENPESISVVIAIDGSELIGYAITWMVRNHAWMGQAWTDPNYDRETVGKEILQLTKDWALEKDIHDIRFETSRSAKALTKAWGFEEFSSIMRMEF